MTNVVGYKQLPDKNEFIDLYVNKQFSQRELAAYYKCTKKRINKWINLLNLPLRMKGGGNNRKYNVTEDIIEIIKKMIGDGYTRKEVAKFTNIGKRTIDEICALYRIYRPRTTSEFVQYKHRVYSLTRRIYNTHKSLLNPNNKPRGLHGIDGAYQIDHKKRIIDCFKEGISAEECASLSNLQYIPWEENIRRNIEASRKC